MKRFLAIAAMLFCFGGNAAAGVMAQCVNDASRFCPKAKQKNVYACLREHASKLSYACAEAVGQGNGPTGHACQNDAARLCGSRKLNRGTRQCLERNFDRLSHDCQSYFYGLGWPR